MSNILHATLKDRVDVRKPLTAIELENGSIALLVTTDDGEVSTDFVNTRKFFTEDQNTSPVTSNVFSRKGSLWGYSLNVSGTGAVTATASVDVSRDNVNWILDAVTLSASGTDAAQDNSEPAQGAYPYHRVRLLTLTGTNAVANVIGSGD